MNYSYKEFKQRIKSREAKAMSVLSFPSTQLMGINVQELINDSDIQCQAMLRIHDELEDQCALVSMMDLSLEAQAFGCDVEFSDDEIPTVKGLLIHNKEEAKALEVPSIHAGRCKTYIEAIEKVVKTNVDRPVFAGVIGPFSLAGRLMDVSEIMIQCMMDEEYVTILLEKSTTFLKQYIKAYKDVGASGVVIAEPLAGLLSPDWLKQFSSDYIKEIVDELQDDSFSIIYHNCGPSIASCVDEILSCGCHAYHFGNAVEMTEMLEQIKTDVVVMGNVDPVKYFLEGTCEDMDNEVNRILSACSMYPNFMISSGCDIPPSAKWDNIRQFYKSVNTYYDKGENEHE